MKLVELSLDGFIPLTHWFHVVATVSSARLFVSTRNQERPTVLQLNNLASTLCQSYLAIRALVVLLKIQLAAG